MSSIFGTANTGTSSIFGNSNNNNNNNNNTQSAPAQQSNSSLFGASLFPAQPQQQQQQQQQQQWQQQQPTATSTIFGAPPQNTNQQQQPQQLQQPQQSSLYSTFPPNLTQAQQQDLARSRLSQAGLNPQRTDEKPIADRAAILVKKWDPQSQDTLLQTYLYNAVPSVYAPFYNKPNEDLDSAWEEALQKAPKLELEEGSEVLKSVPVLVRGFWDLGKRVEYQAHTLTAMQTRLHEMNSSLSAVMATHRNRIAAQLDDRNRMHKELEQRTLRLAVKLQLLRGRGYALDKSEEVLRRDLMVLEQKVEDPAFVSREEEIWGRLVGLRERGRWLEEEGKRLGSSVAEGKERGGGNGNGIPAEVLEKTKKILSAYETQLVHLGRELESVGKEYEDWQAAQKQRATTRR
ncbi:hypothetical protein LTR62_001015 [Meristemomyces frigidus]|uniref:Nucleoporin Nup54 alpha-helical domain-containing protein n=1 Tax=Meristemomyces frigidus TaxID=1508187 RepID=A0AAN7T8T7_9PEZI|nr:hypothetical protein LTR62_001015 [Meristemomyces frigidus]